MKQIQNYLVDFWNDNAEKIAAQTNKTILEFIILLVGQFPVAIRLFYDLSGLVGIKWVCIS